MRPLCLRLPTTTGISRSLSPRAALRLCGNAHTKHPPPSPAAREAIFHPGERGFTLLEIALTLLIAGILFSLLVPRLPRLGRTDLEASADRLASTMTYLADEASLRGRIYRLTFDFDAEQWRVAALAQFAGEPGDPVLPTFREVGDDPLAQAVALPPGVLLDAVIDRDGENSGGQRALYFLPEGATESVRVRLREEEGDATTTVVFDATHATARREETIEASP
jgi:prepilin-type N-terminal cleavage/methylation domain-containing protein